MTLRFVDEVTVSVKGGNGGKGALSFRREKFEPRGGPDGGDGGNGGAVIFASDPGLNTLIDLSFQPHLTAENGRDGSGNDCSGAAGRDLVARVPVGCQVFFEGRLVADISQPGARWVAARGGRGGRGNAFFTSSTRQAPEFAELGQEGESFRLHLVLKSVADIGLVGLPNVGKSTLISKISAARPKVADYPFTTLEPHLGVVLCGDEGRFVVADIPGLIPGAHAGKGLGIDFLRHIERTSALAQLVDATLFDTPDDLPRQAWEQFEAIDRELRLFSKGLAELPRIVLFSKGDQEIARRAFSESHGEFARHGIKTLLISSLSGEGLDELRRELFQLSRRIAPATRS